MKLSIVIPAYNEEKRISPTLGKYYRFLKKKFKNSFEIIVVPNNCKDNTLQVVQKFAKGKKQVRVINIPYYVGKGGAVMTGFKEAKGDYIGFTDADGSTRVEEFLKLYDNRNNFDGIISSRKVKGAKVCPKRTLKQDLSSWIFNKIVRILFRLKYKDTQCGAKLFKKSVAKFFAKVSKEHGWIFDVELLCLARKKRFRILEYPINWTDCEGSVLYLPDQIKSLFDLFRYRFL
jgi:glycosyltransferase involved in cell wall biosynthesis